MHVCLVSASFQCVYSEANTLSLMFTYVTSLEIQNIAYKFLFRHQNFGAHSSMNAFAFVGRYQETIVHNEECVA